MKTIFELEHENRKYLVEQEIGVLKQYNEKGELLRTVYPGDYHRNKHLVQKYEKWGTI